MNHLRVFTPKQVNQMIPTLVRMLDEIRAKREEIFKLEVQIDACEIVAGDTLKENGGSAEMQRALELYNRTMSQFNKLIDDFHDLGCFIKDIDTGLVDFPMSYQGRIVYLCWMYGESQASHWHETGQGFSSREALEPKDLA